MAVHFCTQSESTVCVFGSERARNARSSERQNGGPFKSNLAGRNAIGVLQTRPELAATRSGQQRHSLVFRAVHAPRALRSCARFHPERCRVSVGRQRHPTRLPADGTANRSTRGVGAQRSAARQEADELSRRGVPRVAWRNQRSGIERGVGPPGSGTPVLQCFRSRILRLSGIVSGLLDEAIRRNYCAYPAVDTDPTFASIRHRPEFGQTREAARACRKRFEEHVEVSGQASSGIGAEL